MPVWWSSQPLVGFDKPLPSPDDLLTLALAGLYASGARHALVKVILRSGKINRKATPYTLRAKR